MEDITLAVLLSARLCHDLVSPVGAIHNGLEIIEDEVDRDMLDHAQSLIRQSAQAASARLQFYRVAFGVGGNLGENVQISELHKITVAFSEISKVDISWECQDITLQKDTVRLLMNLLLVAFEGLPRGGHVRVGAQTTKDVTLSVDAEGPKTILPEKTINILQTGGVLEHLEPKQSNLYLTYCLAKQLNTLVECAAKESGFQLSCVLRH